MCMLPLISISLTHKEAKPDIFPDCHHGKLSLISVKLTNWEDFTDICQVVTYV